jgi:hypothetical protein
MPLAPAVTKTRKDLFVCFLSATFFPMSKN